MPDPLAEGFRQQHVMPGPAGMLSMTRFLLLMLLLTSLAGCTRDLGWEAVDRTIQREYPEVPTLSTDELAARLDTDAPRPVLLDVRREEEHAVSHLPGARRVEPGSDGLPPDLEGLDRDTPIVTYCSVGYRSAALAERLRTEGFTDVRNLEGSLFRWANEGRPVVRGGSPVREVHPYDRTWGLLLDRELRAYRPGEAAP